MKIPRLAFVCLLLLLCAVPLRSQDSKAPLIKRLDGSTIAPAEVDATVTRLIHAAKVTGLGIAILNDGQIVYRKGYGFRDKEKSLALTPDTVMAAASFTKSAFAYLAMQLVEQGVLDLDKPVYEYLPKPLPEYERYGNLAGDPRYKKITAAMLLSHSSGFPNLRRFTDDGKLSIHFDPGSRYAYSGEGMELLQFVVETVTKKPLADLMRERVFQPLGMSRTSMVWEDRFENDYANGYDEQEHSLGPQKRKHADAAGSMQTTVSDYARFIASVRQGTGLRRETREKMLRAHIQIFSKHQFPTFSTETTDENKAIQLSYGMGWGLYQTPYGRAFFKEGHDDGWRNYAVCFDKPGIGIVIMTNSSNGEGIFKELLETLLRNKFTPVEWEGFGPYDAQK